MSFASPILLWLLVIPVGLLVWELLHLRRSAANSHPKILQAEAGAHSLTLRTRPAASVTEKPRFWLYLGLSLGLVALARPQWGRIEEQVFDQSREILIAVDLSRSMLAPDVKPSRLARAKLLIESLLGRLEGERVGLVVFSGTAFLQSPLSADYEILREFLPALGPDYLPEGGTNYQALLDTTLQAFGTSSAADRFLIVLSDGEATDTDWKASLEELKKKGIRVIGLGIGTSGGAMIPDGSGGFVKDERGAVVLSKLESSTLQELAQATKGVYRDASAWLDLPALLQATVEAGRKGAFTEKNQIRLVERFQWALAPALLCLLLSFWREFPVRPKPRELALTSAAPARNPATAGAVAAALVLLLPLLFTLPASVQAAAEGGDALVAPLSKVVGRLSAQDFHQAADWAELARTTLTYGQHLQTSQQPVPEGTVRDALSAVDAGEALDANAADWPQLRKDLEALLKQSEQQKQQPPPQDQKDEKKPEQNKSEQDKQDQPKPDQSQQQKQNEQQKQDQSGKDGQPPEKSPQSSENKPDEQKAKPGEQKNPQSAFGEMKDPPPPPSEKPPSQETQKVGGTPDKKGEAPKNTDPALTLPLQKLDQLRNQDSPAKLFQLMEGDKKSDPKKKGKDW